MKPLSVSFFAYHRYFSGSRPRLCQVSAAFAALLGYEEKDLLQESFFDSLLHPLDRARYWKQLSELGPRQRETACQIRILTEQGQYDSFSVALVYWQDTDGACYIDGILSPTHKQPLHWTSHSPYVETLGQFYQRILEIDCCRQTAKCLSCGEDAALMAFLDLPMEQEDAFRRWVLSGASWEDRERLLDFIHAGLQNPEKSSIYYQDAQGGTQLGTLIPMEAQYYWFCSKPLQEAEDGGLVRELMRFSRGTAAFELHGNLVTPLYASENICSFFGMSREEWLPMMKKGTPVEEFVRKSDASLEDFQKLLETGEQEFPYYDLETETEGLMRAVCSEPTAQGHRYVMLYDRTPPERSTEDKAHSVFIRTFGYFDVFVGEKPIAFRNKKSKELFALLVDRKGGFVTSEEAITFLWEDETVNPVTLSRYRKVALRLKNMLEEYGISRVVETVDGKRRIVPECVDCDLYRHLSGKETGLFKGSYLSNYSWGETTLAELLGTLYES